MSELVHVLAETDALIDETFALAEHRAQPYITEARKRQIDLEIGRIVFELEMREAVVILKENK